jgi:hypothetical protein
MLFNKAVVTLVVFLLSYCSANVLSGSKVRLKLFLRNYGIALTRNCNTGLSVN